MVPEQRRFVGIILLVVGIVSLVMSGGVIAMISSARAESADRYTEMRSQCKQRLGALGGTVDEITKTTLVWKKENLAEGPTRLGEASVAAVLCPGWKLRSACMGTECPDSNAMRVVLEATYAPEDEEG